MQNCGAALTVACNMAMRLHWSVYTRPTKTRLGERLDPLHSNGDETSSAQQGSRGSPPGSEGEGGRALGPTLRSKGLDEAVLAAVALHGAHWAVYHADMS